MQTIAIHLVAFLFVVGVGRAVGQDQEQDYNKLLEYICGEQHFGIAIRTVHDFNQIASLLDGPHARRCSPHVEQAIREFAEIVKNPAACSVQKSLDIASFSERYLRDCQEYPINESLPEILEEFVIAYGMKMSKRCKDNMIDSFMPHAKKLLSTNDFEEVSLFADGQSPIARLLDPITSTGDFVLPSDLKRVLPGFHNEKFFVQVKNSDKLNRVEKLCEQHYQPLYEEALLPIAYLARAGFDHRSFRPVLFFAPWLGTSGHFWTRIVFLCEYLKGVKYEEPTDDSVNVSIEQDTDSENRPGVSQTNNEYKYDPKKQVGDVILRDNDSKLRQKIKQFDANKQAAVRLQEKINKNSFYLLVDQMRYSKIRPLFKGLLTTLLCKVVGNCENVENREIVDKQMAAIMSSESYSKLYSSLRETGKWLSIAPLFSYVCLLFSITAFVGLLNDPKLKGTPNPMDKIMANLDIRKEVF